MDLTMIDSLVKLIPNFIQSKCERHESEILRVLQVICRMDNVNCDTSQGIIIEFFINVRELLRTCWDKKSNLAWKAIEVIKNLSSNSSICELLYKLQLVPVLSQYLQMDLESEKAVLLLSLLDMLTYDLVVDRSGYWLSNTLKYLANAILLKSEHTLPHLLAILSNLGFENPVVISQLVNLDRSQELLDFLVELPSQSDLVLMYKAQVVFSCIAVVHDAISETKLFEYIKVVIGMLHRSFWSNDIQLIKRCCCILLWMPRDGLILDRLKASPSQKQLRSYLEGLIVVITTCNVEEHKIAVNQIIFFTSKILRTQLFIDKEFTEAFITALIPLLNIAAFNENLLELLADLINIPKNPSLNEESTEQLIVSLSFLLNKYKNPACKKSCKILGHVLEIFKKFAQLFKMQPSNNRIYLMLKPETFSEIVSIFTDFGEEVDQKNADLSLIANPAVSLHSPESRIIVVQCLTIFEDIAFREREQLPIYSDLLAKPNVQQCLASAIVLSDCQIKQDALALIGRVGFNRSFIAGLSYAMDQLYSRRGSATNDKEQLVNRSILNVTMSPEQIKKLDKITQNMKHDEFWEKMNKCDVVEMLELQIARRKREELRLLHDLDSYKQEVDSLKMNKLQIGAENDRIMAMLLSKARYIETKDSKNLSLSRCLESMTETQRDNQLERDREIERLQMEKKTFEVAQTEVRNKVQSQLDAAMKQIRNLSQKSEDIEEELKKSQKSCDVLKLTCEKKSKELDKLSHEFQEIRINSDNLGKMVREKEKETEEKDREIISLNQAMKKSEMLRKDLETRLIESEKSCQETKEKLDAMEETQRMIKELSSGR